MNKIIKTDSIFFDLDGTLWDGVDTYVNSFNDFFMQNNIHRRFTRDDLVNLIGIEEKQFLAVIFPDLKPHERQLMYHKIEAYQYNRIATDGGILYEGVKNGLDKLSKCYKLFIVSNCAKYTIKYFMEWADIKHLITDSLAYGVNHKPKHENIQNLMEKHNVEHPVYIGDTASDASQCELIDIPFGFVSYGFGESDNFSFKFDSFGQLVHFFTV